MKTPPFHTDFAPLTAQTTAPGPHGDARQSADMGKRVAELQKTLADVEAKYEVLRKRKNYTMEEWEAIGPEAAAIRTQLFNLTGDWYGRPKVKKVKPSDEALEAEYPTPDDVPKSVMEWLVQRNQILTSDATDAVRWARIVDTERDPRYPSGDLTIYRAVVGDEIRPGDWVTTDRNYAQEHARRYLGRGGQVVEMTVDGRDVLESPTGNSEEAIYAPREFSGKHSPNESTMPTSDGVTRFSIAEDTIRDGQSDLYVLQKCAKEVDPGVVKTIGYRVIHNKSGGTDAAESRPIFACKQAGLETLLTAVAEANHRTAHSMSDSSQASDQLTDRPLIQSLKDAGLALPLAAVEGANIQLTTLLIQKVQGLSKEADALPDVEVSDSPGPP